MENYVLSCCSTVDLTREQLEKRGLAFVNFHFTLDGKDHPDDLWQTISPEAFYNAMKNGGEVRTSQVNISEYLTHFCKYLENGQDVLHISLSSGISGTYGSAVRAAAIARERYPERKVYIVDSLGASSGYGLLMDQLADLRDAGMGLDDLRDWAEENRLRLHHWFFSADLKYYVRGGRISKAAGLAGGLLGICPLLDMDAQGCLTPRAKIRGKKKVIREIVSRMQDHAAGGAGYSGKCYLCHSDCLEDAQAVAELVSASFPQLDGPPRIYDVGTVIGAHTGPGTVALFFWGDERK